MRQRRSDKGVPKYSDAEIIERNSIPEPNSGCWLWYGSVNSWGYGRLDKRIERQAHRLSYLAFKGSILPICSFCTRAICRVASTLIIFALERTPTTIKTH